MSKKKKISKILICSLSVISIIAMLTLSAFAAAPGGYTDSGYNENASDDYLIYVECTSFTYNGTSYTANYPLPTEWPNRIDGTGICISKNVNQFLLTYANGQTINLTTGDVVYCSCSTITDNVIYYNDDMWDASNIYSVNDNYYCTYSNVSNQVFVAIDIVQPEPLEKTYAIQFYNNDTYFSSIKVSGMSTNETTFSSISSIKYGNTEVYSNGSWVSGYSSTIEYTSETAPDITTLNSDLGGIVTFTTQYREPNFWDGVMAAVSSLMTNIGTTANAIVQNEYLSIFCLVLPLLSLAVGLLVRMKNNG